MIKLLLSALLLISGCFTGNNAAFATVSSAVSKVQFAGDGVSTSFNFGTGGYSVPVYLNTDIQVYVEVNSTGAITQLTLNNQYSVTLTQVPYSLTNTVVYYTAVINLAGGSSPFGALPVGDTLIINRSIPYTNLINVTDYSSTPAATWNQGYDRATMLSQQLNTLINQAVLQPISATSSIQIPVAINGYVLCWSGSTLSNCANNGTGTPIPIPIPNSDLVTLTQAGLVNGSSLIGSGTMTSLATTSLSTGTLSTTGNISIGGNVGVGSLSPGQSLDVVGTVRATSFTGQGGSGIFGAWNPYSSGSTPWNDNTVYQAATDGFVVGYGVSNITPIIGYTDSSNSPSTIRFEAGASDTSTYYPFFMPVRKGDYWEITIATVIYWIPLGS